MVALFKHTYTPPQMVRRPLPYTLHHGDCLDVLRTLPDNSIDAVVTDPPSGIAFMGKQWDTNKGGRAAWIAWLSDVMAEVLRVLKPGGHAFVWALPRTSHWTACALEDAGFDIKEKHYHLFGSGFPKSHDISKAIDREQGAERETVGKRIRLGDKKPYPYTESDYSTMGHNYANRPDITAPATPDAERWQGWGTATKPAVEEWILARKPLAAPTVAANVLAYGTGGLNIDASRVGTRADAPQYRPASPSGIGHGDTCYGTRNGKEQVYTKGRWPANLLLSHTPECQPDACSMWCPVRILDEQSGNRKSGLYKAGSVPKGIRNTYGQDTKDGYVTQRDTYGDEGGASRFFQTFQPSPDDRPPFLYCAKASRAERNRGCEGLPEKQMDTAREPDAPGANNPRNRGGESFSNHHPTVKPLALMRYLATLITPPGGTVLDPFMGSGTTGIAAVEQGFSFVGIEQEADYLAIAEARLAHVEAQMSLWNSIDRGY